MKKENRSVVLQFRVTPTEAEQISGWVDRSRLDLPDYLRFVIMRGYQLSVQITGVENAEHRVQSLEVEQVEETSTKQRKHGTG